MTAGAQYNSKCHDRVLAYLQGGSCCTPACHLYDKFTQDNMYPIFSESVGFCRRYDKTFWYVFSVHSVVINLYIYTKKLLSRLR